MSKKEKNINKEVILKKEKKEKSTFVVRAIATVFLLMLLISFCATGIIYQEIYHNFSSQKKVADAFGYLSLIITIAAISYCFFELTKSFKELYKWYLILIVIFFNLVVFLTPTNLNIYDFLFYGKIKNVNNWLMNNLFIVIFIPYLVLIILIGTIKTKNMQKSVLFVSGNLLILFGIKAFSIFMLSGANFASAGKFSYLSVIWIWAIVIFTDTFAYLGGMKFGKNKMSPVISPKKTWEGAFIGGLSAFCLGVLWSLLTHFFAQEYQPFYIEILNLPYDWLGVLVLIMLSAIFPIISILGDLFFSLVKRTLQIKDYSKLIPGHGGMLDRIDSLLAVLTVSFILIGFYNS